MSKPSPRDRLAQAAFELFDERGYEQATIDDIAERAGLGRTTFFRHYRAKEDVIFPDHDRLLEQIRDRLRTSGQGTALSAVSDAVRLVLLHYLEEGELARRRYALTSAVPALRDREIATVARYQRLFREFIAGRRGDPAEGAPPQNEPPQNEPPGNEPRKNEPPRDAPPREALRAELMAASVVAAHNHVLRRWLRGEHPEPVQELDDAMREVSDMFAPAAGAAGSGTTIVAFHADADIDAIAPLLRRVAAQGRLS